MEARRPPANILASEGAERSLTQRLKLLADLQVWSVSRDVRPWLAQRSGDLLEIGCGEQPYRRWLPEACNYVGLEHQDATADFEMKCDPAIIYYSGDRFPVAPASFDAVFHTEVLEHVYDTAKFLTECRRALKPGGEMMFSVPFQARYHFIPHDFFRFTPAALQRLLGDAGFEDVVVTARGNDIGVAAYKVAAVGFRWAYGDWRSKIAFLLFSPLTVFAVILAHLAMRFGWGSQDDCLGYSVTARAGIGG